MGNRVSIDKHLSSVDDILDIKQSYFKKKIRFDSKIPDNITHHIKVRSQLHSSQFPPDMKVLNETRQGQLGPLQAGLPAEPPQSQ